MTMRDMTAASPPDGCIRCGRSWPNARFTQEAAAIGRGESEDFIQHICDLCLEFPVDEIGAAVDEAQGVKPDAKQITREVVVTGVESKSNIVGFRYLTHRGKPLAFTDLTVEFKGAKLYQYAQVPVAVCEAMIAAPSIGSFFAEQVKLSYQCQKL